VLSLRCLRTTCAAAQTKAATCQPSAAKFAVRHGPKHIVPLLGTRLLYFCSRRYSSLALTLPYYNIILYTSFFIRLRPAVSVTLAPGLGGLNAEHQASRADEFA
jgi:hypothetical protein